MAVVSYYQVGSGAYQRPAQAALAAAGGVTVLLAPMHGYHHQMALFLQALHHVLGLGRDVSGIVEGAKAHLNPVFLHDGGNPIAHIGHAPGPHRRPGASYAPVKILGVVVGVAYHVDPGAGQDAGVRGLGPENIGFVLVASGRGEAALQVGQCELCGAGKVLPHVFEEIAAILGAELFIKLLGGGLACVPAGIPADGHVAQCGDGDGLHVALFLDRRFFLDRRLLPAQSGYGWT